MRGADLGHPDVDGYGRVPVLQRAAVTDVAGGDQDPGRVGPSHALPQEDDGEDHGRDRVERREQARDVEPSDLGGHDERRVSRHVQQPDDRGRRQHPRSEARRHPAGPREEEHDERRRQPRDDQHAEGPGRAGAGDRHVVEPERRAGAQGKAEAAPSRGAVIGQ